MAQSSAVSSGELATATQYNNLRDDVLSVTTGHLHDGSNGRNDGAFNLNVAGLPLTLENTTDGVSNQILLLRGDNATRADNDEIYITLSMDDDGGNSTEFVRLSALATDVSDTTEDGQFDIDVMIAGTLTKVAHFNASGLDLAASDSLSVNGTNILADSAGTMTLSNIDALDATTEATIEAAIDTSANLTSIQGLTVTLADAGADAIFGWDDTAGAYENLTQAEVLAVIGTASPTAQGVVELATAAETDTGTSTALAVSPDGLAGSNLGEKVVQLYVIERATDCATGDGKIDFVVPSSMTGMDLVEVHAECITAGTTGTMDIQIHNATDTADMLSTKLTIDSAETGSDTAATAAVINTAADDVATFDVLRIDIDAVHTTAAKGLYVTMIFRLP